MFRLLLHLAEDQQVQEQFLALNSQLQPLMPSQVQVALTLCLVPQMLEEDNGMLKLIHQSVLLAYKLSLPAVQLSNLPIKVEVCLIFGSLNLHKSSYNSTLSLLQFRNSMPKYFKSIIIQFYIRTIILLYFLNYRSRNIFFPRSICIHVYLGVVSCFPSEHFSHKI